MTKKSWFKLVPLQEPIDRFDPEPAIRAYEAKFPENKAMRRLAMNTISIGYKVLTTRRASEGMSRLNEVRKALKQYAEAQWPTK
jgi:hypothetical protein